MTAAARPGRGGTKITIATAASTTSAALTRDGMWDAPPIDLVGAHPTSCVYSGQSRDARRDFDLVRPQQREVDGAALPPGVEHRPGLRGGVGRRDLDVDRDPGELGGRAV